MILRFINGCVATGSGVIGGADIAVSNGFMTGISGLSNGPVESEIDLEGGWLLPGFIDVQVNGGGGVLFNDQLDVDAIATIGSAHARFGTTAFLPTLISDTPEHIAGALDAVDAAIEEGVAGVVGIHVEGPFINEVRRGIHEPDKIRRLDPEMLALLTRPRRGKVLVTLAPEQCSLEDIRTLVAHSVIVSAGHTNASYAQAMAAIDAGLSGFTHLFNAMSPLHHRDPGAVGAALDSSAWCGLIVDGVHLHPAAVRLAVQAKGIERIMLVTDAMPSVGSGAADFMLQGKHILVRDGACLFEDGTLAGAHLDMASAVRNTVETANVSIVDASTMASASPAHFLSLFSERGEIAVGKRADWVWLGADLKPRATWIGGLAVEQLPVA